MTEDRSRRAASETVEQFRFSSSPHACMYLHDQVATMDYRVVSSLVADDYSRLLRRGWRRFGYDLFRPRCTDCIACRSLRIVVAEFQESRRHRRNLQRNDRIDVVIREPSLTDEHLDLLNSYHDDMHRRRGWPVRVFDREDYRESFLAGGWEFSREFLFFCRGNLVGVGLADVLPDCMSSIYFFHDPQWRTDGPGVFSVLSQIEFARKIGLTYVFLGYWVEQCPSMAYKSQYRPHQLLSGRPGDDEEPLWTD